MRSMTDISVAGYVANEIDFRAVLARQTEQLQEFIQIEVVTPLVEAEMVPETGRFCAVTVVGHGDRVDTPGMSAEQRRELELTNTQIRAEAAEAYLFDQVFELVQAAGGTPPVDLASMQSGGIFTVAAGAADLVHKTPGNDEGKRRQNRRVQFLVASFVPETPSLP